MLPSPQPSLLQLETKASFSLLNAPLFMFEMKIQYPHHHRSACLSARFNSAHGRLGTGDNKCRHEPVRLKVWPPGFPGCVVQDIALGGAHSIVLAHRSVTPLTLANPWRAESLAYAWGYGYCGQLGLGRQVRFKGGGVARIVGFVAAFRPGPCFVSTVSLQ